ncbi:MAG: ATPase domain-containing protein [Polyangiaceae bacterium]
MSFRTWFARPWRTTAPEIILIDSITGYFNAMPDERYLSLQMHELLAYLSERQVATVVTVAQSGMIGTQMSAPIDLSYLADTILLFRYFESLGRVKKAISVLKRRSGYHEDSIRELSFDARGIKVGAPLERLHGVLSGMPRPVNMSQEGDDGHG